MEKKKKISLKANFNNKIVKRVIIIVVILAVIAGGVFGTTKFIKSRQNQNQTMQQRTARVIRDDLTVFVTGSGPIQSAQSEDLTSTVSSTITNVFFKDGDRVKKGDIIFELENQDAKDKIDSIKSQIDDVSSSLADVEQSIKDLQVTAPISGCIKNLNLSEGDRVAKGSSLFTIIDTSKLKVTLPFSQAAFGKVKLGHLAIVYIPENSQSMQGMVTYISNTTYTNEYGGKVFDVEITISNPGALQEGMKASAEISTSGGSFLSTSDGSLEYVSKENVKAKVDGDIDSVLVRNNQYVTKGTLLVNLSNDDLEKQKKNYESQLKNLQDQLKEAEKNLKEYYIRAPFDIIVTYINFKKGDSIKPGETLATVFDDKNLVFNVDIDELDIAKIKVGQKVNITVDALPETEQNPLSGKVSKIPLEGTTQNGVTTYSVTISIDNPKNLKIGMNANAEIIVNQKQNTLMVPLEAVQKFGNRYFVFVKTNGSQLSSQNEIPFGGGQFSQSGQTRQWQQRGVQSENSSNANWRSFRNSTASQSSQSSDQGTWSNQSDTSNQSARARRLFASLLNSEYYKGSSLRTIEVGINNDQYIEVVSGLSKGDIGVLPPLSTGTSTTTQTQQQGFGFMGGFGGPPAGEFRQFRQQSGSSTRSSGSSNQSGTNQSSSNLNR